MKFIYIERKLPMSEYISNKLTECLFGNGLITANELDDYRYFTQLFLEKIIGFTFILIIAASNHFLWQTIFFLLFFSNIRKYSGGFHARNFFECMSLSLIVYLGYTKLLFPYLLHNLWLNTYLLAGAVIIILTIGAVNHPNMHWDEEEYIMCKNTARMVCVIEVGIIIAFSLVGVSCDYVLFMSFGVILSAVMLLIAKSIRQEVIL